MKDISDFFRKLFDGSDWPPRWHCGKWTEFHGWLYIISDLLIWSAYFAIPVVIMKYLSKKHNPQFIKLYFLFAAFILACGATHFLDAVAFWLPLYRLNALVRLITGILSWATVFFIVRYLPLAASLRTQNELESEIEQRIQAEDKVRILNEELEEKVSAKTIELAGIFERITDGFLILDKNFVYTYANKKIGEMTGLPCPSLIGKNIWEVFPEAVGSPTFKAFHRAMSEQVYYHNIDYFQPLDLWYENHIYPSGDGLSVFVRDITEQKKAEIKIRESEKIYKTIASSIPGSVICLFDHDYRYLLIEGDMLEKLGYRKENLLDRKAVDVLPPGRFAEVKNDFERVFAGLSFTTETRMNGYDVVTRFVPLKDENGMVYSAMAVVIDVTELKSAQLHIQELNIGLENKVAERTEQLAIVNQELEAFTYSVSHDLRAPLRIIDGFADILTTDYAEKLDGEGKRTLGVITSNARRMGQLIDDLLNLSRLGRQEIATVPVNMSRLVRSVIAEQLQSFDKVLDIPVTDLLPASCDSSLIHQVWANLISNAIKYSARRENPEIQVGSYQTGTEIIYSVKDNGVGFDMKYSAKLFGVFQRLHKITEFEGTGVGLALVQRIVAKHGGRVWAASEVGKGSTFCFSLPIKNNIHH
ncbi:MAG TPA: ATP-binding protein [Puia sp.]|nr:ATP-binding protein [Puia sp.]